MLNSAASSSRVSRGRDGDICIDAGVLSVWCRGSLAWQDRELELALENFAFIAAVTTLAPSCRFVGDSEILIACYDGLPFTAVAFHSQNRTDNPNCVSRRIRMLTRRLVVPDETFYCLVGEGQRPLVESAFSVVESNEEWQIYLMKCRLDVSS